MKSLAIPYESPKVSKLPTSSPKNTPIKLKRKIRLESNCKNLCSKKRVGENKMSLRSIMRLWLAFTLSPYPITGIHAHAHFCVLIFLRVPKSDLDSGDQM